MSPLGQAQHRPDNRPTLLEYIEARGPLASITVILCRQVGDQIELYFDEPIRPHRIEAAPR